jgi:hypothetical protein
MSGIDDDDLSDLLGPDPVAVELPAPAPAQKKKPTPGRELQRQSRRLSVRVGKLNSPDRLRRLISAFANMPVAADACRIAGISTSTLKYWLAKSMDGAPGDGFDVTLVDGADPIRFHVAWQDAEQVGVGNLEAAVFRKAMGQQEPLTFQGRVIYKIDPVKVRAVLAKDAKALTNGADCFLLDALGNPIPESVTKQDPDLMMFILKARKADVYGNRQQVDVSVRGGVLVVGTVAKTAEALNQLEEQFRKEGRPAVTFEDDGDNL